jgi:hypothetical protein
LVNLLKILNENRVKRLTNLLLKLCGLCVNLCELCG